MRNRVGILVGVLLLAAAAGCSKGDGSPSAQPSPASVQAYAQCMRDHGVPLEVPSARPSGEPRPSGQPRPSGDARPSGGPGRGFGQQPPDGVDQATFDAAQQACAALRPSGGPGGFGGPDGGRDNGAAAAYRNCLRDHGVTASTGPDRLNSADPAVAAALAACAPLRPTPNAAPTPSG